MKKILFIMALCVSNAFLFSMDFIYPPELKWWIDEIQKVDEKVSIEKFEFSGDCYVKDFDSPISYINKLYPVFKKWNFYGNQFAYYPLSISLKKEKNGKYSIEPGEADSEFAIFDRDETLCFLDFFGSSDGIDSYCWIKDNRIIAVGSGSGNTPDEFCFYIHDYIIKDGKCCRKSYQYIAKNVDRSKIRLRWWEQRSDYFETAHEKK